MRIGYILLLAFVLVSCEKELSFDNPDFKPKLVLNGFTSSDSTLSISLSKSTPTLVEPSLKLLSGQAKVLLLKDGLLLLSDDIPISSGRLLMPYRPIEGSTYELQVSHEDLPTVRAIDSVPLAKPQISIDTLKEEGINNRLIFSIDDKLEDNRYMITLNLVGKELQGTDSVSRTYPIVFASTDKTFLSNIRTVANGSEFAIFSDQTWNGNTRQIELIFDTNLIESPDFTPKYVDLEVKEISKTMYDYYISVNSNTHVYGGPLASVSRVAGNVEQGLGAFCFYTQSTTRLVLP